ncbi:MAG: SVAGG family GlyGly-CTERM protein [Cocleimonas sp.]
MKTVNMMFSLGLGLVSFTALSSEQIDVLFVIEPSVYESVNREGLSSLIKNQINVANSVHATQKTGISYKEVAVLDWKNNQVSEKLAQGRSFTESVGEVMYSLPFTESEFNAEFAGNSWYTEYQQESRDLLIQYHADKLVFVSSAADNSEGKIGYAYSNFGVIASLDGLKGNDYLLVHEWGHNIGLGHTDSEICSVSNYIMCSSNSPGATRGFNDEEMTVINGVVERDPEFILDRLDSNFVLGDFSTPMQIMADVKLSLLDNPIANTINQTEAIIDLVDESGMPVVLNEPVSVELYTQSGTAIAGESFDNNFYQRVTFAAGESTKRIDLDVTHINTDASFNVGTRYGLYLGDSDAVSVTVKAKAKPTTDVGEGDDGGSGGSLGFSLLSLVALCFFRKN